MPCRFVVCESAGNKHDAGSQESALNTAAHEELRNSRKTAGQGQGRGYRGNGNTSGSTISYKRNNDHTSTSNGNSSDGSNAGRRRYSSEFTHSNQGSVRGGRRWGRKYGKNVHGRCSYCRNSTEHSWHDCLLRLSHQQSHDPPECRPSRRHGRRHRAIILILCPSMIPLTLGLTIHPTSGNYWNNTIQRFSLFVPPSRPTTVPSSAAFSHPPPYSCPPRRPGALPKLSRRHTLFQTV